MHFCKNPSENWLLSSELCCLDFFPFVSVEVSKSYLRSRSAGRNPSLLVWWLMTRFRNRELRCIVKTETNQVSFLSRIRFSLMFKAHFTQLSVLAQFVRDIHQLFSGSREIGKDRRATIMHRSNGAWRRYHGDSHTVKALSRYEYGQTVDH